MLELKNVSKFYYSKGMVASGFTKINLKLNIGEFVAITGESGSGKSTLLNVISGLDTYEEGEMYINGEETSGYTETDLEQYRKTYIANIFQNFNLVNSYTVYQNIELMLLMNGFKANEIKEKIIDVIKKVDLLKYKNTKVSKLSGGQKQRVAIARALIKDTPIIVADEPTGNLDSKSANSIIKLLSDIAESKLVIVVTHNYDQVEKYVTRKIKMHDGKIIEDKTLKQTEKITPKINKYKGITKLNKLRLGIRNAFNIIPKFLLLLLVYLFLSVAVISEYSSYKKQEYVQSTMGYNNYFKDTSDKRIIIKKNDKTSFTEDDYNNIKSLNNTDYIIENDLLIDSYISVSNQNYYFTGITNNINLIDKVDLGRMPENDNEIVIEGNKNNYYFNQTEELLEGDFDVRSDNTGNIILNNKLKVVGIKYGNDDDYYVKYYMSDNTINEIRKQINATSSNTETLFNNTIYSSYSYTNKVTPNYLVPQGNVYISDEMSYLCKDSNCINYGVEITTKNIYFEDKLNLTVSKMYTKKNLKSLLNLDNYDETYQSFYINTNDYYNLFTKGNYQSSVYIKDIKKVNDTIGELQNAGYQTLYIKDALVSYYGSGAVFLKTFKVIISVIVTIALFFIAYFIIKIILKSRNIYYSTIRILGATRKNAKELLNIELLTVLNMAYLIIIAISILVSKNIIAQNYIKDLITYLKISDYLILYAVLFIISLFISNRYARKLFKKSAMESYREEV